MRNFNWSGEVMKVGVVGLGFVGGALERSFGELGVAVCGYDKYKELGSLESLFDSKIIFLCLPTPYVDGLGFDISAIEETLQRLSEQGFGGLCVIKSTVEIGMTEELSEKYRLNIAHNPEFLTERTAFEDFHSQNHIVVGKNSNSKELSSLITLYEELYPSARISVCTSGESEAMKLFANNFYALKVGFFNELALLCGKLNVNYDRAIELLLLNGWVNKMHTTVPGPDGKFGWGGNCFPKDTEALNRQMKEVGSPNKILQSAIDENKKIRE